MEGDGGETEPLAPKRAAPLPLLSPSSITRALSATGTSKGALAGGGEDEEWSKGENSGSGMDSIQP